MLYIVEVWKQSPLKSLQSGKPDDSRDGDGLQWEMEEELQGILKASEWGLEM